LAFVFWLCWVLAIGYWLLAVVYWLLAIVRFVGQDALINIIAMDMSKEAVASCAVFGSYLIGYSSYSKATGSLKPELLLKILGLTDKSTLLFTLRETNKVLALAGLTVLGASFTGYLGDGEVLRQHSAAMLLTVKLYT
jgi:hypothetical protein